jgi:RNA polymerase sigma-70 factor (ECF subfamily)
MSTGGDIGANPAVEVFEAERARLTGVAYRMTGSYADAEDVVQEAWVRFCGAELDGLDNPAAWLTTVVSRLSIDRLRVLARRREDYVGPWLPEPVATGGPADPAAAAEMADSLTLGFLVLLDELGPTERLVFLLADVFGEPYSAIASTVGRSEGACRQIASRVRRKLRGDPDRPVPRSADRELLDQLVHAVGRADPEAVTALLHPEVRLISDGGPHRHSARRPVVGPFRVARLLCFLGRRTPPEYLPDWRVLNGQDAFCMHAEGRAEFVLMADQADGRILAVRLLRNPDKLGHVDDAVHLL